MKDYARPERKQERQERRKELRANREVIQEQLADLNRRLPALVKPAVHPEKQGSISKKRPGGPLLDGGLDSKRQRLEQERSRRVNGVWQQCQTILKGILKSKDAFAFSKPVNPITAKCPDYFDIIKHPMDLGTIQKKLPKGRLGEKKSGDKEYSNPYQFRDDMRLVWSNCRNYNAVGHAVRTMGDTLSESWEKKWALSGIEAKWEEEMQRQDLENKEVAGGDLAQQMHSLDSALQQRMSSAKPQKDDAADGMNFERKRRLSIALGQLPGDRIADVMRIIAEDSTMREKVQAASAEEVEVDIDQLSASTLSNLERYANGILQSIRKKSGPSKPQPAAKAGQLPSTNGAECAPGNGIEDGSIAAHSSASSSSDESGTERSRSRSHSNDGSQNESNVQKSKAPPEQAQQPTDTVNNAATLISTTRPPNQPQIVKNMAAKKVTNLQNEADWAQLKDDGGKDEEGEGNGDEPRGDDLLWDEFRSREQEEEQREKEKQEEELRQKTAEEEAAQAAKLQADQAQREIEAKAQQEEDAKSNQIKAQREQELEQMKKAAMGTTFTAGGVETMDSRKQGEALNNMLGLQHRDSESDADSE